MIEDDDYSRITTREKIIVIIICVLVLGFLAHEVYTGNALPH